VEPRAYKQTRIFDAAKMFLKTEGILPAPESSHAVAAAIDEAVEAREKDQERVILFNLSGHGFLDINAYDR
jgi:tryptophan synthase beta chain